MLTSLLFTMGLIEWMECQLMIETVFIWVHLNDLVEYMHERDMYVVDALL